MTKEELYDRADTLDQLADNEDNEVEFYRLRHEAAQLREQADEMPDFDEDDEPADD